MKQLWKLNAQLKSIGVVVFLCFLQIPALFEYLNKLSV